MTHASRRLHLLSRRVLITLCRRLDVVTTNSDVCRDLQFLRIMINYAGEGMFRHPARPHTIRHYGREFSRKFNRCCLQEKLSSKEVS